MTIKAEALHAERAVLGAIMLDEPAFDVVAPILAPTDFHQPAHAAIYAACVALREAARSIDVVTIATHLEATGGLDAAGGIAYVLDIAGGSMTSVNVEHHARIVADAAATREGVAALRAVIAQAESGKLDSVGEFAEAAQSAAFGMRAGGGASAKIASTLAAPLEAGLKTIQEAYEGRRGVSGIPSGFSGADDRFGGYARGSLTILAARPAMGKSAKALIDALNVARAGQHSVALYSLEMTTAEIVERLYSMESRVEADRMRSGHLDERDIDRLLNAAKNLRDLPLVIEDASTQSLATIRAHARRVQADTSTPPLGLIVIDYIQLMSPADATKRGRSREQEIAEISRGLKALAKDFDVAVLALSQLNRSLESRPNKRPMLSDLRESGALEQDANRVIFVYRDEVYNPDTQEPGIAELICGKNRGGRTGTEKIAWEGRYTAFRDLRPGDAAYAKDRQ